MDNAADDSLTLSHQFRSNWVVDPVTGTYTSNLPTPTGIASDPSLAAHGVNQSKELASHISTLDPPVDVIYSSPFYRCLQTLAPSVSALNTSRPDDSKLRIHVENGLGEFYGLARFDHPSPATLEILHTHFPDALQADHEPAIRPSVNGESLDTIHDRIAYCLHRVIAALDKDPKGPKALLICTHAASMICIGRALTGNMPEEFGEEDFRCFTCSLSKFERRKGDAEKEVDGKKGEQLWDASEPETVPEVGWRDGTGVGGGWECVVNGDCSFLEKGEERGWYEDLFHFCSSSIPAFAFSSLLSGAFVFSSASLFLPFMASQKRYSQAQQKDDTFPIQELVARAWPRTPGASNPSFRHLTKPALPTSLSQP